MEILIAVLLSGLLIAEGANQNWDLQVVLRWKVVNFSTPVGYPSDPDYDPASALLVCPETSPNRIFLTSPRISKGIPATLSYIPRFGFRNPDSPPPLQAYPSWDWHSQAVKRNITNCNKTLVSVFRIFRDRCKRLWVLDSGVLDSAGSFETPCPPKIVIFDENDKVVKLIPLPDVVTNTSLLTNFVVDDNNFIDNTYGSCDSVFVYISDTTNPAVIVHDLNRRSSWRLTDPCMRPVPKYQTITIDSESFNLADGVLGMAVTGVGYRRCLYFSAYASIQICCLPTVTAQRGSGIGSGSRFPIYVALNKSSQSAGLIEYPPDGSLLYNPVSQHTIESWKPNSYSRTIIYNQNLQPITEYRPDHVADEIIWFLSSRQPRYFNGNVNLQETNIWLMLLIPKWR